MKHIMHDQRHDRVEIPFARLIALSPERAATVQAPVWIYLVNHFSRGNTPPMFKVRLVTCRTSSPALSIPHVSMMGPFVYLAKADRTIPTLTQESTNQERHKTEPNFQHPANECAKRLRI